MRMIKCIILLGLWLSFSSQAQQNFQKIYLFEDTFTIFNDVYVTDSCYYYTCTSGKGGVRQDFNFGKLNFDGTEQIILLDQDNGNFQNVMFSKTDMDTNFRGNFITSFTNSLGNVRIPRIKEINQFGTIVNDFELSDYWNIDSLEFYFLNRQIIRNEDSSYLFMYYKYDYKTDDNSGAYNGMYGVILINMKFDGTILWEKHFNYTPQGINRPIWFTLNLIKYSDTSYLMVIEELKQSDPTYSFLDKSKIHFIEIDLNGNQLNHQIFLDGQNTPGYFGCKKIDNGELLFTYFETLIDGIPPNNDFVRYRPVVAKLNNNFDLVWKKNLWEMYGTEYTLYSNMHDVKIVDDSLFVGAFEYVDEILFNEAYYTRLRLSQYNTNGTNKWNRDYSYFPTDNFNDPEYGIYDLELTPDGGYIMCGEVFVVDSFFEQKPCQYGYVLKTNCLGFLGDAIAEFSYSSNKGVTEFVNEGIQAGSYQWIFGDGDTLNTTEYVDTVEHNYLENGNYSVQLIAYGCNGINDTISKTITVSGISSGYVGDGTLLTIYPNPISGGESLAFYVGNITEENVTVEVVNVLGQIVFQGQVHTPNTTYIVPLNVASGEYFVSLRNESDHLEVEKLIVR